MFKILNRQKGAITLSEMLVVVAIIGILAAVMLINYPATKKQLAFQRAASKLVQDIRRAQEMAMAAEEVSGSVPAGGYGIYLTTDSQTSYILFADQGSPPNYRYGSGEQIGSNINFESGVKIKTLDADYVNIVFVPPDPTVYLTDGSGGDLGNQISIIISLIDDTTKTKTITVNKAGLITVQ